MKRIKFTLSSIKSFVWRAAFVLLGLCLITSHFSFRYAAKYVSRSESSDNARVATFQYIIGPADNTVNYTEDLLIAGMYPGATQKYEISITNNSEVVLQCKASINNFGGNLPLTVTVTDGTIPIGETVTCTLTIGWDSTEKSPDYAGKVELIELTISVEQVD